MSSLNPPIRDWAKLRIWIIGASTGIGKALGDALLEKGARVAVSARRAEVLEQAFGQQPHALRLPLDITDNAAMAGALDSIHHSWGRLDLGIMSRMASSFKSHARIAR